MWVTVRVTGQVVIRAEDDGTGPVCKPPDSYRWRTLSDITAQHHTYLAIGAAARETIIEITAA